MLTPDGRLALIDFGTARDVTATYISNISQGRSMTAVVSSGYTAPEQTNGKAVEQSDFFALARTFVQLLTGKHPLDMYAPIGIAWTGDPMPPMSLLLLRICWI